jgi:RNase adapter protein RapZ
VDNLPPRLITQFIWMMIGEMSIKKCAIAVDVRAGAQFSEIYDVLEDLEKQNIRYEVLYLDAADDILIRRYKETRRIHPLSPGGSILEGIRKERLENIRLKNKAKFTIDTSSYTAKHLQQTLFQLFSDEAGYDDVLVSIISFGYKYGIPVDADMVLDLRFLPNPFYVDELRDLTGMDDPVKKYVFIEECALQYIEKAFELIKLTLPYYKTEGKHQLVIALGCTGGRHRSVAFAEKLYEIIKNDGNRALIEHRHINLDSIKLKDNA